MTSNSTRVRIGAASGSGTHVFRATVDIAYSMNHNFYNKILKKDNKVLFINTGSLLTTGWIISVDSSTKAISDVLFLDGGTSILAHEKCAVQVFNG